MAQLKPRVTRVALNFLGDGWQDCYLDFSSLRFADMDALATLTNGAAVLDVLKGHFLSGKGVDTTDQVVDLSAEDIDQLDVQTVGKVVKALAGLDDPNA